MDPEHLEANRRNWDERVDVHVASDFYDVEGFLAGKCPLRAPDLAGVGDVSGKRLVHLQCHFGLDTLAWARRGARVTGVDFSSRAIEEARKLAARAGLAERARFVECDVHAAVEALAPEQFDVVFVNVGAIGWLPSIARWADVVTGLLAPGGRFYIREGHPMLFALDERRTDGLLEVRYPYFEHAEPLSFDDATTYAAGDGSRPVLRATRYYAWSHGLGEVVMSLLDRGLVLERLDEHRECDWKALPDMVRGSDDMWRLREGADRLPFTYSIVATKPA